MYQTNISWEQKNRKADARTNTTPIDGRLLRRLSISNLI